MSDAGTPLQQDLMRRIIEIIHEDKLEPGARLRQSQLAERLRVSRTPVRMALELLEAQSFVRHDPNRGMMLVSVPPRVKVQAGPPADEEILVAIARLRREGKLPEQFAELELMRLTGRERTPVRQALIKLEGLGVIQRRKGYGWQFFDPVRDKRAREESYDFRLLIETAAILSPAFSLSSEWIASMKAQHNAILASPWTETSSVTLFEMNAAFHLGISAASGNRYIEEAMNRQNQLRRLSNYNWQHGSDRVAVTCREHLEILDRLERGDNEVAAVLMRKHLSGARETVNNQTVF
ncbi:GntR family transcriptional regulator [Limoniibacter endophyticus]|uniref:GntR family transcriptional regulator n=1 Tax=Limoniibacter endophyticus TaxID=1565040 RepID=A0A8J3DN36_9HYPH|nr:GntR family transcriptional regulator [Limoniibacter endophyticus]GHC73005.1 GntR family transcriptional regulator [Limoniibacter endophyticus]